MNEKKHVSEIGTIKILKIERNMYYANVIDCNEGTF